MGAEILLYGYGLVCLSMLVFNLLYSLHLRSGDRRLTLRADALRRQVTEQLHRMGEHPDGLSRPVSVYVDSSRDPALLARTRSGVIYGEASSQTDGETTLTIDVPQEGEYYMFIRMPEPPWAISASVDGAEFREYGLLRSRGNGPRWISFGGCTYRGQPNRPTRFTAGRHTIRLRQLRKLRY